MLLGTAGEGRSDVAAGGLVSNADIAERYGRFRLVDEQRIHDFNRAELLSKTTSSVTTVDIPFRATRFAIWLSSTSGCCPHR